MRIVTILSGLLLTGCPTDTSSQFEQCELDLVLDVQTAAPGDIVFVTGRPLTDTLDTLYAQSDRLWHMYLADVHDMGHAVDEHAKIHGALRSGDAERVADLVEGKDGAFCGAQKHS